MQPVQAIKNFIENLYKASIYRFILAVHPKKLIEIQLTPAATHMQCLKIR